MKKNPYALSVEKTKSQTIAKESIVRKPKSGYRFKELRDELSKEKKRPVTQAEMCSYLGNTQANISQLEYGACLPTGDVLNRLKEAFPKLNMNWFTCQTDGPVWISGTDAFSAYLEKATSVDAEEINALREQYASLETELLMTKRHIEELKTDKQFLMELLKHDKQREQADPQTLIKTY